MQELQALFFILFCPSPSCTTPICPIPISQSCLFPCFHMLHTLVPFFFVCFHQTTYSNSTLLQSLSLPGFQSQSISTATCCHTRFEVSLVSQIFNAFFPLVPASVFYSDSSGRFHYCLLYI